MGFKYIWKTKPYRHQVAAIKKALALGDIALLMQPRTGKSKTAIDYFSILSKTKGVRKVFIVCPARIMDVWADEINAHCPYPVHITIWDRDARSDKKPIPQASAVFDIHVVITNYETFSTPGAKIMKPKKVCDEFKQSDGDKGGVEHTEIGNTKRCAEGHVTGRMGSVWNGNRSVRTGRFKHRALVTKWIGEDKCVGILDEFHRIQDNGGKWTVMLLSMRDLFSHRLGLTGTPIPKASKIHVLWTLWQWINPERFEGVADNLAEMRTLTGVWLNKKNYSQYVRPKTEGVDAVHERIHEDSYAIRLEECFDMPRETTRIVKVDLSRKTGKMYDDMAKQMYTELESGDEVDAQYAIVQAIRLSQITSGFISYRDPDADVEPGEQRPIKIVRIGQEKLLALKGILQEEIQEHEQKVIIAARFKTDLDRIACLCDKIGLTYYQLRGGMSRAAGTRSWKDFNAGEGPSAFIMQPAAGGMGIDLRTAPHFIWFSLTDSFIDFTQAGLRNARSEVPITITYLEVPNSIDQLKREALLTDGDVAKRMLTRPHEILRRTQ